MPPWALFVRRRLSVSLALGLGVLLLLPVGSLAAPTISDAAARPALSVAAPPAATAPAHFFTGMNASLVLGRSDFTSPAPPNASTLCNANGGAFDRSGDLWVADYCDNRVVEFRPPFFSGMPAALVLGQPNFTANAAGTSAVTLNHPSAIAFDAQGDLWVVDTLNNRVLEYGPPFVSGMAARLVLGQPTFDWGVGGNGSGQLNGPDEVTFDASGDLWVAEFLNNRLSEFVPPFATGMPSALVLGQPGFGTSAPGTGPSRLRGPFGIAFDASGALWVADTNNNRLLAYRAPFVSGENATGVLGQPDFYQNAPNVGPGGLYGPNYITFDPLGNLWVADTNNNRVLKFPAPVTSSSWAQLVLGQPNMTGRRAHTSANGMSNPAQALPAPDGSLFVVEFSNSRVLHFAPPFGNGSRADLVIGQNGFDTSVTAPTARTMGGPGASVFDASGNLWAVDTYNNRVLEFSPPFTTGEAARAVIGQPDLNDSLNGQTAKHLFLPEGLAFAPDGTLWVADTYNDRVLGFEPPFFTGMAASVVLGQPNFTASNPGTTDRSLFLPGGIACDAAGDLWVADTLNSRVLEFVAPLSTDEPASTVIGQPDFTSASFGTSPQALFFPSAVAFGPDGTLYVADTANNRVLAFASPLYTDEAARAVVGQTNFYSGGPGTGPGALEGPHGLSVDPRGTLWVTDPGNNRVVGYPLPETDGSPARVALGQPTLTASGTGTTSSSLRGPIGVTVDAVDGGLWVADYTNRRLLYYPGDAVAVATGNVAFVDGAGSIDQRAETGVRLSFSGVSGISSALVVSQRLAGPPAGLAPVPYANASYFAIALSPLAGVSGVVRVCLTVVGVAVQPSFVYWTSAGWEFASLVSVQQNTVCGQVPISALAGTPLALSVPGPVTPPSFSSLYLFGYATLAFVIVAAALVYVNLRRQRRRGPPVLPGSSSSPLPPGPREGPPPRSPPP